MLCLFLVICYHSDDVTCNNETSGLKKNLKSFKLFYSELFTGQLYF